MIYPVYDFSPDLEPPLDYPSVLTTVKQMSNDLLSQKGCCNSKKVMDTLKDVSLFRRAIDDALFFEDQDRYESYVKSAYLMLYPLASE